MIVLENEIKFPSMMEESVNEEHANFKKNVTDRSLNGTRKVKGTQRDIISPLMLKEFEDMIQK